MNPLRQSIRDNIRHFREQRGFSQEELSRKCNFSPSYLGKVERGSADPSLEVLIRVADVLDLSPLRLLDRSFDRGNGPSQKPEATGARDMFGIVFQNVEHPVGLIGDQRRILMVNRSLEKCSGMKMDNILGTPLEESGIWRFARDGETELTRAFRKSRRNQRSRLYRILNDEDTGIHLLIYPLTDPENEDRYWTFEILWSPSRSGNQKVDVEGLDLIAEWGGA